MELASALFHDNVIIKASSPDSTRDLLSSDYRSLVVRRTNDNESSFHLDITTF